jgi:hypothetical protein
MLQMLRLGQALWIESAGEQSERLQLKVMLTPLFTAFGSMPGDPGGCH